MNAETSQQPKIERLGKHHDKKSFSSGVAELDEYFRKRAGQDARNGVAAPFVLVDPLEGQVAGYYTLSATTIPANQLPAAMARRLPRYPEMPATLLGRLAVDRRYQGKGYGDILLTDALLLSLEQSKQIASFAVMGVKGGLKGARSGAGVR